MTKFKFGHTYIVKDKYGNPHKLTVTDLTKTTISVQYENNEHSVRELLEDFEYDNRILEEISAKSILDEYPKSN